MIQKLNVRVEKGKIVLPGDVVVWEKLKYILTSAFM